MFLIRKLKTKLIKAIYSGLSRSIRNTPPVSNFSEESELVILSMVRSSDVDMLLVAIKSFTKFVSVNHFVIVTDDDVRQKDKENLIKHLVRVRFIEASSIRNPELPRGGCWERLTAIAETCSSYYVIQLDADTITYKRPQQVIDCIEKSIAFTLGTRSGTKSSTLNDAAKFAEQEISIGNKNIQIICESLVEGLGNIYSYYVRGCAGFTGFPKNSISINQLIIISKYYKNLINSKWDEWGTEQFTSNLIISNIPDHQVLNLEEYNTAPKAKTIGHYIGTIRFESLDYSLSTMKFIKKEKEKALNDYI